MVKIEEYLSFCQGDLILLEQNGKRPIESKWTTAPSKINGDATSYLDFFNLGYRLPDNLLVVDVDPRNGGATSFDLLPASIKQLPRTTDTPSGGWHIYTTIPDSIDCKSLKSSLHEYPGIDFLHKGKQVVIPSSTLDTGATWRLSPSAQLPPPLAPDSLLDLLVRVPKERPAESHSEPDSIEYLTRLELSKLLEILPTELYNTNAQWEPLMMACHHATDGHGLEAFLSWSAQDDAFIGHDGLIRQRWESLKTDDGPMITIRSLIRNVGQHSIAPSWLLLRAGMPSNSASDLFRSIATENDTTPESQSFESLKELIATTDDVNLLLTSTLVAVGAASEITESMRDILLRQMSKKAGSSVTALRKDLKLLATPKKRDTIQIDSVESTTTLPPVTVDPSQVHTLISQATITHMQTSNNGVSPRWMAGRWFVWNGSCWDGSGGDNIIKQCVHRGFLAQNVPATANQIGQVADMMALYLGHSSNIATDVTDNKAIYTNAEVLELIDGQWHSRTHDHLDFNLSVVTCHHDTSVGSSPTVWLNFLQEMSTSAHAQRTIACAIVYAMCGSRPWLRKAFYVYGPRRSGKSTLLNLITDMIGKDNCSALNISQVGTRFGPSGIVGKLANISNETVGKKQIEDDTFKALVSGEPIRVEEKFGQAFDFMCTAKMFFAANVFPKISDESEAVWDRLTILSFPNSIETEEADHHLGDKLRAETPQIFNWCLQIFAEEYTKDECRSVMFLDEAGQKVMDQWRHTNNPALDWVKDRITRVDYQSVDVKTAYADYRHWCMENGHRVSASNSFSRVVAKVLPRTRTMDGTRFTDCQLKDMEGFDVLT